MLINHTPEQLQYINDLRRRYSEQLESITDSTERAKIHLQFMSELENYEDECERRRFERLGKDPETILQDGLQQIDVILRMDYDDFLRGSAIADGETLRQLGFGTTSDGKLYLNANVAAELVRDELKLHIEALKKDKARLQRLFAYIVEAVEDSDYTDNSEITIPESKKAALEVMRYRRNPLADIQTYGLMNDKANALLMQDGDLFQQQPDGQLTMRWAINQAPQNKEPVATYIALTYEGTEYKITKKLTAFDKAVYDAIGTRFFYWKQQNPQKPLYITPQEIWRTMNGKRSGDGKANPGKVQVKRICASMDKMRYTRFVMNISEELKAHYITLDDERIAGGVIESYLINSSKVEFVTDKGNTVIGYRIGEEPILYTYNAAKDHLLYVPYEMLDTSTNTNDGENVTEFRNYLLQQIKLMMNAAAGKGKYFKRNHIILLDSIYKDTGTPTPEDRAAAASFTSEQARQTYLRKTRKADRDKIEGMLDAWTTKGWIKGYTVLNSKGEPVRTRQQAKGYSISI